MRVIYFGLCSLLSVSALAETSLQMSAGLDENIVVAHTGKKTHSHKNGAEEPFVATASSRTIEVTMAKLMGNEQPVELRGTDAALVVNLPVPALREFSQVNLLLQGTVSNALIASSQLVLRVNGHVIGQFRLSGNSTKFKSEIEIPVNLLHPGYNAISVRVAQHYTEECELPLAPQLWTQIDVQNSLFRLVPGRHIKSPSLADLSQVFDKTTWESRPLLNVMTQGQATPAQLQAMALATQGAALRYDYVPMRVFAGQMHGAWPGEGNVILLGSTAELASLLPRPAVASKQAVLAIRPLPGDERRSLILLAADNEQDMLHLAQAFAMPGLPLPNVSWVGLNALDVSAVAGKMPASLAVRAASEDVVPLQFTGFRTTTFTFDNPATTLQFWNNRWQGRAQLRLHLAYASGMSPQSSLNVLVNHVLVGSVPLNDERGAQYDDYMISIPGSAIAQGWNTLELQTILVPLPHGGKCTPFFMGNLATTVYEDSTLDRIGGTPLREPDLSLLTRIGQTDTADRYADNLSIQLMDKDHDTLSAGLTLLAKMAQVQHRVWWKVWMGEGDAPRKGGHLIMLGKSAVLPDDVRAELDASRHYAVDVALGKGDAGGFWYGLLPTDVRDFFAMRPPLPDTVNSRVNVSGDMSGQVFALALEHGSSTLTVFTASSDILLARGIDTLTDYTHWGQMTGRLSVWQPDDAVVHSVPVDAAPVSAFGLRGGLGIFATQHLWLALLAVLLVVVAFVLLTPRVLRLYRERYKLKS